MTPIHFKNENLFVSSAVPGSLKEASLKHPEKPLPLGCQKGRCGTCLVRVSPEVSMLPPNATEAAFFKNHRIGDPALRLGCQLQVAGPVTVETLTKKRATVLRRLDLTKASGPLPEIGFSTNVLDNPADVAASVARLSQNFTAVELELGEKAEDFVAGAPRITYESTVLAIRRICEEKKVCLSVHAPYLGHNLAAADPEVRKRSQERLRWAVRVAADLGANKVTCHPGYIDGRTVEGTVFPLLESLEAVMPDVEEKKITLCLENMGNERPDYIVYSAKQQERICKTSGAWVALDVVHLASLTTDGNQFEDELATLLPWIQNIHFADMHIPKHVHIPLGEGNLPFISILAKIRAGGYQGPAIVEEFGGPYITQTFIDRAVQFKNLVTARQACA